MNHDQTLNLISQISNLISKSDYLKLLAIKPSINKMIDLIADFIVKFLKEKYYKPKQILNRIQTDVYFIDLFCGTLDITLNENSLIISINYNIPYSIDSKRNIFEFNKCQLHYTDPEFFDQLSYAITKYLESLQSENKRHYMKGKTNDTV